MSCPETEHFVSNWNRIHKQTVRAIEVAAEDKLDWRPKEGMFTLGELVRHLPQAENYIANLAMAGSMEERKLDLSGKSVSEVVEAFEASHASLAEEVSKLTLDQLNEEIEAFGRTMRRVVLLWGMTEHEIHHRGQLMTYYRLADIEPPKIFG